MERSHVQSKLGFDSSLKSPFYKSQNKRSQWNGKYLIFPFF